MCVYVCVYVCIYVCVLYVCMYYIYIYMILQDFYRILQYYNSLKSSQYGGVSPTKNPMVHCDVQRLVFYNQLNGVL